MTRKFASIDVFDTCLIRRCGKPEKIWDLMADNLFEKNDFRGRLSFVKGRENAEKKATSEFEIPTLDEIYSLFNVCQWGFEKRQIADLEMQLEEKELIPNSYMQKKICKLREDGCKIYFVSDMYLPSAFIKKILFKYNLCMDNESVLVSAEYRATKHSGKLFDCLFKMTQTKASQWLHYGDNLISDVGIPKIKGMKSKFVKNTSFSEEERRWLDDAKFYPHQHEIELWAGLSRMTRLQLSESNENTLAANFITSIYIPYIHFVLSEARKKGIKRLFFLSRDGFIFLRLAKVLQRENDDIDCQYLKVSRKSLYPCIFFEGNDYEFSLTLTKDKTVAQNLDCIGIPYRKLSEETRACFAEHFLLNSDSKIKDFEKILQKNDVALIKDLSLTKRKIFLNYLKQEDFFSKKAALVDLGWVGTGRCALNYILRKENFSPVPMFYWGINQPLIYGMSDDELFVFNRNFDFQKKFSFADMLLEHYASMNDETTIDGYQEIDGKIVSIQKNDKNCVSPIVKTNLQTVELFAKKMRDVCSLYNASSEALYDVFLCCGLRQMERILELPNKEITDILKNIQIEDFGITRTFASFLTVKDVLSLLVWGVPISSCWDAMSIRKTFGIFAPIFNFIYVRTSKSRLSHKLISWWERKKI